MEKNGYWGRCHLSQFYNGKHSNAITNLLLLPRGATSGIFGWGCAASTLETLAFTSICMVELAFKGMLLQSSRQ